MLDAALRAGRVVQVGTQQRSGQHYQRARELIQGGNLGKIVCGSDRLRDAPTIRTARSITSAGSGHCSNLMNGQPVGHTAKAREAQNQPIPFPWSFMARAAVWESLVADSR